MNEKLPQILSDSEHYHFIEQTARAAGAELRKRFRSRLTVSAKPDRSIVTDADLASEQVILAGIRREWPDDAILSEEAGTAGGSKPRPGQHVWIVDPLDGTTNFANGYSFYSVSIARWISGLTITA
jgi:myo-inositol-1(or 4)-monophosphatase